MHPSQKELELFVDNGLADSSKTAEISAHVEECEFCREFCENYRLYKVSIEDAAQEEIPLKALNLGGRLLTQAMSGRIIDLRPLGEQNWEKLYMAADGEPDHKPGIINLGTLYSEDPELVLRVMRDSEKGYDYLQLIADDPLIASHVMVRIPEIEKEFLTDDNGRAILDETLAENIAQMKWQIKMPDAVFSLQPLVYDPEAVEYKKEMILETEKKDKIVISFEGKTEGKQITVRIQQLEGKSDFGQVIVSISQQGVSEMVRVTPDKAVSFGIVGPGSEIKIRLFQ